MNATIEIGTTKTSEESLGNSGIDPETEALSVSDGNERPTLVIGDIHGNVDRLEGLLRQEGILDWCPECDGTGTLIEHEDHVDCPDCDGDGVRRINHDVEVVLLGDLGHFGKDGSPTGDVLTWYFGTKWADVILWGNHDRAMADETHAFRGFFRYPQDAFHHFAMTRQLGKLKLAHSSHGYLFTHAGLALAFRHQKVDDEIKRDPAKFADWINEVEDPNALCTVDQHAVRDAISRKRGGHSSAGGILWRDINEKLYDGFPQIFGHSADDKHRVRLCWKHGNTSVFDSVRGVKPSSFCIDIGGKPGKPGANCIAGIWLPDERVVTWSSK